MKAFKKEMRNRQGNAQASYDARRQAYDYHTLAEADIRGSGRGRAQQTVVAKRRPRPSRPRILGLSSETNVLGLNQRFGGIGDEQYGFFTVINDAFFDGNPKVKNELLRRCASNPSQSGADSRVKSRPPRVLARTYMQLPSFWSRGASSGSTPEELVGTNRYVRDCLRPTAHSDTYVFFTLP